MARKPISCILCHNADGISNYRLALQELLHNLDIDIALICETKLPAGFVWRNHGYRTYNIRGPNHADRNQYAISAPDKPTYYSHRTNVRPDVLDIFLHHMGLPKVDVETLYELNSDHNTVLLTVDSSITSQMLRGSGHFVRWDEFRRYLRPIELPSDRFCPPTHWK